MSIASPAVPAPAPAGEVDELPDASGDAADESGSDARTRWLTTAALLGAGVAGRAAFQTVPSVEPLLAATIAAGFYGGWKHGAAVGAAGYVASNALVWGGNGPWTVFQAGGAALAGMAGASMGASRNRATFALALVGGVLAYEIVVNLGSLAFMGLAPAALLAAVPFAAAHLASTAGFGAMLYGGDALLARRYR